MFSVFPESQAQAPAIPAAQVAAAAILQQQQQQPSQPMPELGQSMNGNTDSESMEAEESAEEQKMEEVGISSVFR